MTSDFSETMHDGFPPFPSPKFDSKLLQACYDGDYEMASTAIFIDKEDVEGDSAFGAPLYVACELGRMDIAKLLVLCGADINKKYGRKQNTILHTACENGDIFTITNILSIKRVDVNIKDRYGDSPIHDYLSFRNNTKSEIFRLITSREDFDWNCKDNRGYDFKTVVEECDSFYLCKAGCGNTTYGSWNECERCDKCCTCVAKCPCDDKHCDGDCGTQGCGVCIDTCRCYNERCDD